MNEYRISLGLLLPTKTVTTKIVFIKILPVEDGYPTLRYPDDFTKEEHYTESYAASINITAAMPCRTKFECIPENCFDITPQKEKKTSRHEYQLSKKMSLFQSFEICANLETPFTPQIYIAPPSKQFHIDDDDSKSNRIQIVREISNSSLVMCTFTPEICLPLEAKEDLPMLEFVFVLDRSGSMSGSRMRQAINALQLFLRSLPPKRCLFNIIGFGSSVDSMFPQSVQFDQQTLTQASNKVAQLKADLGGTELFRPIQLAFESERVAQERKVIVLTDGEVNNRNECIRLVRDQISKDPHAQVYAMGIGSADSVLVTGIADAGKGRAEFTLANERVEDKVMRQLRRMMGLELRNVKLQNSQGDVRMIPEGGCLSIFRGDASHFFAFLDPTALAEGNEDDELVLSANSETESFEWKFAVRSNEHLVPFLDQQLEFLPLLAALAKVNELTQTSDIIALSHHFNIPTQHTCLVGIDEEAAKEKDEEEQEALQESPALLDVNKLISKQAGGYGPMASIASNGCRGGYHSLSRQNDSRRYESISLDSAPARDQAAGCCGGGGGGRDYRDYNIRNSSAPAYVPPEPAEVVVVSSDEEEELEGMTEAETVSRGGNRSGKRALDVVVALQRADGSWVLDAAFIDAVELIGSGVQQIQEGMPGQLAGIKDSSEVWASALAIAYMNLYLSASSNEWKLLVRKTKTWIQSRLPPTLTFRALLATARSQFS
eukprot:TRINITY_DN6849_c0_g2_i1.p1 TRINITY_DN6849_c0_g2~~TRINITY_DN6849_c0_g2_i1.p1  ORF type:complete len:832 (-),score=162.10 TRINITY_DN6849_c0_g2_i1:36-2189(-)